MKNHDPLCYVAKNGGNCCPWMPECDCQCMCDYINEIRADEQSKTEDIHDALAEKMFNLGYDRALRKAREAVDALTLNDFTETVEYSRGSFKASIQDFCHECRSEAYGAGVAISVALDAIDTLKEKP